jgi:hypothetical protein
MGRLPAYLHNSPQPVKPGYYSVWHLFLYLSGREGPTSRYRVSGIDSEITKEEV